MAIEFNSVGELLLISIKDVYPKLYKRAVHLATEYYRDCRQRVFEVTEHSTVDNFYWEESDEGSEFWTQIHQGDFTSVMDKQPHLFDTNTKNVFVNCFGVEMVEETQLRADDDIAVDFTKKKRLCDF